jgi:hypothetical protein
LTDSITAPARGEIREQTSAKPADHSAPCPRCEINAEATAPSEQKTSTDAPVRSFAPELDALKSAALTFAPDTRTALTLLTWATAELAHRAGRTRTDVLAELSDACALTYASPPPPVVLQDGAPLAAPGAAVTPPVRTQAESSARVRFHVEAAAIARTFGLPHDAVERALAFAVTDTGDVGTAARVIAAAEAVEAGWSTVAEEVDRAIQPIADKVAAAWASGKGNGPMAVRRLAEMASVGRAKEFAIALATYTGGVGAAAGEDALVHMHEKVVADEIKEFGQ